ncbi:MAG: DUF177 domain-containing protein [Actinobacteria bacterium]|nr:DUF177 domain-containing protein [Actinomycetota bacterium]
MADKLNSRQLKVPVTNLLKKVFSRERLTAHLDVAVAEHGLVEKSDRGDLKLEVWLESSPDGVRVKGVIQGSVSMDCTRCLEGYRQELEIAVDEFFRRPGLSMVTGDGRRVTGAGVQEEDEYVIDEGTIDLNLLVNDAVMLSLPIKHLCDEGCKGLCQACGKNLNQGECGCIQESIDPRLEVLRTLLEKEED